MKLIGVTMRADMPPGINETRDGLDQEWIPFLQSCGLTPILIPNNPALLKSYLEHFDLKGILLTGGNSPQQFGGNSPARDEIDANLIEWAIQNDKPLVGVCRGMQSIQLANQQALEPVFDHVKKQQKITLNGQQAWVNSYHTLGAKSCHLPLESWAVSDDGVIKAVKHISKQIFGMMWHPERNHPFQQRDIDFFKQVFDV